MNMRMVPGQGKAETASSAPQPVGGVAVSIVAARNWRSMLAMVRADLAAALGLWRLVWTLSLLDIRLRYRGSMLGPFWLTLSTAVMIGALGFLYAKLFHTDIHTYLPFLSLSLVSWQFLQTMTAEGCTCFTSAEPMIHAMRMPLALHAARVVVRNVLVLLHNVVVIVAVFVIMHTMPGRFAIAMVPALALWLVDGFAVCLLLGSFCARYRDVPPIVASVMQIAFFISPVLWSPTILAHRGIGLYLVKWNPFFALLEIVRGPVLGTPLAATTWIAAVGYSAVLVAAAAMLFAAARARIAYWV